MKIENFRFQELDILRGIAVCGILFVNMQSLLHVDWGAFQGVQWDYVIFYENFFSKRFFPMFSLLFGISFNLLFENLKLKTVKPKIILTRRLIILIIIGIIHSYFNPGEALLVYGILGFFIFPLLNLSFKTTLVIALISLVLSFLFIGQYGMVISMFFLGTAISKSQMLPNLEKYKYKILITLIACLVLTYFLLPLQNDLRTSSYGSKISLFTGFIMMWLYICFTLSVYYFISKKIFYPLGSMGKMALTNYILQTAIVLTIGFVFNLKNTFLLSNVHYLSIAIIAFQLILSSLWLKYFNYGIFEWMLRKGSNVANVNSHLLSRN